MRKKIMKRRKNEFFFCLDVFILDILNLLCVYQLFKTLYTLFTDAEWEARIFTFILPDPFSYRH